MRQILGSLLDYGPYIIIVSIVVTWKLWAPKLIEYIFEKRTIKYRTELETEKEKQLAEYGKRITGFNKFFDKKYDIYPVMYSKIISLQGELSRWAPMQLCPDFEKLTPEEFIEYIDTFGFSKPDRRNLIDKHKLGELSTNDLFTLLPLHFQRCIGETNNYFLVHQLFFSKEIESIVKKFLENTYRILSGYRFVFTSSKQRDQWNVIESTNEENGRLVEDILSHMRSELEHCISKTEIIIE